MNILAIFFSEIFYSDLIKSEGLQYSIAVVQPYINRLMHKRANLIMKKIRKKLESADL